MDNLTGHNIKGYELRERIGAGGFGAVYKAYQSTVGREVAMKIILPGFANHPDFIRRFETEAQLIARLEHLHITPLYDYWREPDGAYLIMRWLKGGSLREALDQGAYTIEAAALLMEQITSALAAAHRSNIIHRDLKPGNILLDEDGNAYLADFGIAKDLRDIRPSTTEPDAVVGSLDYIAPEQARGEQVTPRTDIYSLGVLLYELLVGRHPFPNITPIERLYKHLSDPLPRIETLNADISEGVNQVIQRATAKNPVERYADTTELAEALRAALKLSITSSPNLEETLTQREQDILQRIAEGYSNKEIAQELFIELPTVKWYVTHIYRKLRVRSRVQAMVRARELNSNKHINGNALGYPHPNRRFSAREIPYKGLRAFTSADYRDYFGREKIIEKLIKKLGEVGDFSRFFAVIGPSGSGKSSLVKAGLIPAIWKGAVLNSEKWFVVEMMPGSLPLDELEIALTKVAANHVNGIHEHLARDENGLLRVASLILPNDGSDLLLVIDQFEEVFTLVDDESQRQHFLNLIQAAVTTPRSRVRVLVTMRADFYDRPLHYPEFGELLKSRLETILPLSAEELERAIAKPAEVLGLKFEEGLITKIVSDVNYQAGALPLLQYALTELFDQREGRTLTHAVYEAIGGTGGALAKRAEEIYQSLSNARQESARQMFLRLVTLGEGTEDTRRRVMRSELLAITDDSDAMDEIIDTYAEYRLLSLDNDPNTRAATVELAHEAILREWERLRLWLNETRDEVRLQRQVLALANEWDKAKQDQSFLLRGSRLELFEKWISETKLALTDQERAYLHASLSQRTKEQRDEESRQARELKLAQDTAKAEPRAANGLRSLVALFVIATVAALFLSGIAMSNANAASAARAASDANAQASQHLALISGAQAALATGNTDLALALAMEANRGSSDSQAQIILAQAAYAPGTMLRFTEHHGRVMNVAFSPDGRMAASIAEDRSFYLWDITTGDILSDMTEGSGQTTSIAFSPDGNKMISGTSGGTLILWDVATGTKLQQFSGHTAWVNQVVFSSDGQTALSGSDDGSMILWSLATGELIRRFSVQATGITTVDLHPDGQRALSGTAAGDMLLWNLETGEITRHYTIGIGEIRNAKFSPDGRTILVGGGSSDLILLEVESAAILHRLHGHNFFVTSLEFNADGKQALSGSADATMILWDLETGEKLHQFQGHNGRVWDVAFSPDGRYALSASFDGTVRLWDLQDRQLIHRFRSVDGQPLERILETHYSPNGLYGLTSSWGGTSVLWDIQSGTEIARFEGVSSAFMPDSRSAVFGIGEWSRSGSVVLFDLATEQEIYHFDSSVSGIRSVAVSPDGQSLLTGLAYGNYQLIDPTTGELIQHLRWAGHSIGSPIFSPDGSLIAASGFDYTISISDAHTGQTLGSFLGHSDWVMGLAFSPDSTTLLSSSLDNNVIEWDVASGKILHRFTDHSGAVFAVAFSPDGRLIVSGSADRTLIIRDRQTGEILRRFTDLHAGVYSIAFSPDGGQLLVGYVDGKVELWHIDMTENLMEWAQANRYIPELTCEQRALYRLEPLCAENTARP